MTLKQTESGRDVDRLTTAYPCSPAWAIEQMPCPAYCCATTGPIVCYNGAAARIWGGQPGGAEAKWDGFVALHDLNGDAIRADASPCACAARGETPPTTELFALAADGQTRRIIVHARPIHDADDAVIGVLCCLTDISDKRRLQERVREAAGSRNEFLDMLAHELRNPLAPIMSAAGLLRKASADPLVTRVGSVVERQARQLARFVVDLLDAAHLDCARALSVTPRACTLGDLVAMAVDAVEPVVRERRQALHVDVARPGVALHCDPERVAQALGNVLYNASAFTPDGGSFALRAGIDGETLVLEVADTGPGIAPADLQHVFTPFQRRAVPPGRAAVGAGLGLTISKGVCEAHGGTIGICSAAPDAGTTVSFRLPIVVGA